MKVQAFCKEAVVWKRLAHPNIVPLLGITVDPLQFVSEWMSGRGLREYIENNSDADRVGLVSLPPVAFVTRQTTSLAVRHC